MSRDTDESAVLNGFADRPDDSSTTTTSISQQDIPLRPRPRSSLPSDFEQEHPSITLDQAPDFAPSEPRLKPNSPTRTTRSVSSPIGNGFLLAGEKAPPAFGRPPPMQERSFKDLIQRFNQGAGRGERPLIPKSSSHGSRKALEERFAKLTRSSSPTRSHGSQARLPTRREPPRSRTGSATLDRLSVSESERTASPESPTRRKARRPLFGENYLDPAANSQPGYGIWDDRPRRGSEGSLGLAHGASLAKRNQSDADLLQLGSHRALAPDSGHAYQRHGRSHSDITAAFSQPRKPLSSSAYSSLDLAHQRRQLLGDGLGPSQSGFLTPDLQWPSSATSPSVTPNSSRSAKNYFPTPRSIADGSSPSSMNSAQHSRRKPLSPLPTLQPRRYDPPSKDLSQSSATLRAYVSAPQPQKSPPLRSSRPRQPVSAATTAASRAKTTERFRPEETTPTRRKKKIPELGKIDFAERRSRIEKAISQHLPDEKLEQGPGSIRSSRSNSNATAPSSVVERIEEEFLGRPQTPDVQVGLVNYEDPKAIKELQNHQDLHLTTAEIPPDTDAPSTAHTEIEVDDVPPAADQQPSIVVEQPDEQGPSEPIIEEPSEHSRDRLSPPHEQSSIAGASDDEIERNRQSVYDQVMTMRDRSTSSASRTDFGPETSASVFSDNGSIQIMLGGPTSTEREFHWGSFSTGEPDDASSVGHKMQDILEETGSYDVPASPDESVEPETDGVTQTPDTPRRPDWQSVSSEIPETTPRQSQQHPTKPPLVSVATSDMWTDSDSYAAVRNLLQHYKSSITLTPEMLHDFQGRLAILTPGVPSNGEDEAARLKDLLDEVVRDHVTAYQEQEQEGGAPEEPEEPIDEQSVQSAPSHTTYPQPVYHGQRDLRSEERNTHRAQHLVGTDPTTEEPVLSGQPQYDGAHTSQIQYQAESAVPIPAAQPRPRPPPKDTGYSPRLSPSFLASDARPPSPPSARLSKLSDYQLFLPEFESQGGLSQGLGLDLEASNQYSPRRPLHAAPTYTPPPPPVSSTIRQQTALRDVASVNSTASQSSSPTSPSTTEEHSTRTEKTSRSSPESQRLDPHTSAPTSNTMSSLSQASEPLSSTERSSPANVEEPSPAQRRLSKRRNIIKELVDTEYSYHQDMKIIEDIYKATVGDLITHDDKKALFGNADQVEAFSLEFYDALRRAVAPFYVPPRTPRWHTKRGSFSTSNSGNTDASEGSEEEKDRKTGVGGVFESFLPRMETVYAAYLKNHDTANQRLSKLQEDATVKCWLAECHKNASDITSAWDLDSLLVKPVQRILKYPLLLQQLLESTSADHPDRPALDRSVRESMNISQRINQAKKRADLVEQLVARKRKDSDVRTGIAKILVRRTDKLKERVGIAEAWQDPEFDELAHKFGGHFIRLQVCMRDVQGSLVETDRSVERFSAFAQALESYVDLGNNHYPEIESKWRKYIQAIKELTAVALAEHKATVKRRVIDPMVQAIKLHEGPQNAITKRKKRIVDYAKCKSIEKRGEKPDKRTLEASELYEALNEQLKIDLPRLYSLTASLIQACLACHREIQMDWLWTWEMKLRPVLDSFPKSLALVQPEFQAEFDNILSQVLSLGLCNGSMLADATNFLSPQTTLVADDASYYRRQPLQQSNSSRTLSTGDYSPMMQGSHTPELPRAYSGSFALTPGAAEHQNLSNGYMPIQGRGRSSSSISNRGRAPSAQSSVVPASQPQSRMPSATPKSSFSNSRPNTSSQRPADLSYTPSYNRASVETSSRSPRPGSGASYFTAQQDSTANQRYSGMFSSALPMTDVATPSGPTSPRYAPDDIPVMFVAASLFEFNIDRARREAGYPYLTYVQGEVFDVVGQKGELWLAKNQDDATNSLGWIWEQHFVILSQEQEA